LLAHGVGVSTNEGLVKYRTGILNVELRKEERLNDSGHRLCGKENVRRYWIVINIYAGFVLMVNMFRKLLLIND